MDGSEEFWLQPRVTSCDPQGSCHSPSWLTGSWDSKLLNNSRYLSMWYVRVHSVLPMSAAGFPRRSMEHRNPISWGNRHLSWPIWAKHSHRVNSRSHKDQFSREIALWVRLSMEMGNRMKSNVPGPQGIKYTPLAWLRGRLHPGSYPLEQSFHTDSLLPHVLLRWPSQHILPMYLGLLMIPVTALWYASSPFSTWQTPIHLPYSTIIVNFLWQSKLSFQPSGNHSLCFATIALCIYHHLSTLHAVIVMCVLVGLPVSSSEKARCLILLYFLHTPTILPATQ